MKMIDRNKCDPKPKLKLIREWPIDIGASQNSNSIYMKMIDQYRCDPKPKLKLIRKWSIDIGAVQKLQLY